jgi:OTU domain-containing protein 6
VVTWVIQNIFLNSLIEDVTKAEWGGQLELRAISSSFETCIIVYEATSPVLKMGEEFLSTEVPPVRLSFHKYYYALGEHYNSVVPKML